jgi:hypothetical protein
LYAGRYLKTISKDHFAIDQAKVEDDAKFDGMFVLRTNTDRHLLDRRLRRAGARGEGSSRWGSRR